MCDLQQLYILLTADICPTCSNYISNLQQLYVQLADDMSTVCMQECSNWYSLDSVAEIGDVDNKTAYAVTFKADSVTIQPEMLTLSTQNKVKQIKTKETTSLTLLKEGTEEERNLRRRKAVMQEEIAAHNYRMIGYNTFRSD